MAHFVEYIEVGNGILLDGAMEWNEGLKTKQNILIYVSILGYKSMLAIYVVALISDSVTEEKLVCIM